MDLNLLIHRLTADCPILPEPVEEHPQMAAVLVILFKKKGRTHVLLIKRAERLRVHPGQISFPGGVFEAEDKTLHETALRETWEELELEIQESDLIARLPQVHTLTGFEVNPFVCVLEQLPEYRANPDEVAEVLEVPLVPLLNTHHRDIGHGTDRETVAYWYQHHRVWGATAKILHRIGKLASVL